jgi:hypothetical protein
VRVLTKQFFLHLPHGSLARVPSLEPVGRVIWSPYLAWACRVLPVSMLDWADMH